MGKDEDIEELNGGIVCLVLILVAGVGAIAGGTLLLTVATYLDEDPEPINLTVGDVPQAVDIPEYEDDYYSNYDDEIWTISVNYWPSAQSYLDDDEGVIQGLNIDIVEAVCRLAHKNCQLIRDTFANQWSDGLGGHGIHSGRYDGALGYDITYSRIRTFSFTEPFSKALPSFFGVPRGNGGGFDWEDLTGKKIGFLRGILSDEICISRYDDEIEGSDLSDNQIILFDEEQDLIDAVNDGEVDALFLTKEFTNTVASLEQNGPDLTRCQIGGASVMSRKDSHVASWWNPAWAKLLKSAEYTDICEDFDTVHNFFGQSSADFCY